MNITFLIGNGFDLNLGLSTTYAAFVKKYKELEAADEIKAFRNHIADNEELWSSAEIALGRYTAQLKSGQGEAFSQCHADICRKLAVYLKTQQNRVYFGDNIEKAALVFANLSKLGEMFPAREKTTIDQVFASHMQEEWTFNFINFNYTNTLDRFLQIAQIRPDLLGTHNYGSRSYQSVIGRVCHVHGTVDKEMVFGVNDETQIENNEVFECENGDLFKNLLIKQRANESYLQNTDEKTSTILNRSNIICIYGMSIGETDKLWWSRLCKWLSSSQEHHLIVQKYGLPEKGVLPIAYQVEERKVRQEIMQYGDFSENIRHALERRIHVTDYNIFGAIEGVALSEERTRQEQALGKGEDIITAEAISHALAEEQYKKLKVRAEAVAVR